MKIHRERGYILNKQEVLKEVGLESQEDLRLEIQGLKEMVAMTAQDKYRETNLLVASLKYRVVQEKERNN